MDNKKCAPGVPCVALDYALKHAPSRGAGMRKGLGMTSDNKFHPAVWIQINGGAIMPEVLFCPWCGGAVARPKE